MLAVTFGVSRNLVMQALRKHYQDFSEQSSFTEAMFVPTYLWIYGIEDDEEGSICSSIVKAIDLSGTAEPGCRSVFAIARDFVILYLSEVVHGAEASANRELGGLSSITAVMSGIKIKEDVPPSFLEMSNAFLYRARMTGRQVLKARVETVRSCGGTIAGLFS